MSFPTSPTNGQQTTLNGILYTYASATRSWTRVPTSANSITTNFITVTNNSTIGGNQTILGNLYIGATANTSSFTNPIFIGVDSGAGYVQAAIVNTFGNASADFTAYSNNGTDVQGWVDMGFTGNTFNDTKYTITGFNDGYLFANGVTGNSSLGGNLVIATGSGGSTNDIIFATGGFLLANEKMRFSNATSTFRVTGSINSTGSITVNSLNGAAAIINGGTTGTGNIGATGAVFNTVFAKATSAQYADLAEKYLADHLYSPGTVVVFGGDKEITQSTKLADNKVAGVISTNPAYQMNSELVGGLYVALTGRVPCNVVGNISRGDMLVTSEIPGVATTVSDPKIGQVIGKALENYNSDIVGVIEVVVGRQ